MINKNIAAISIVFNSGALEKEFPILSKYDVINPAIPAIRIGS